LGEPLIEFVCGSDGPQIGNIAYGLYRRKPNSGDF
jgi:hypothetical protein